MKQKPDLSGFAPAALTKDPSAFLDAAIADRAEEPIGQRKATVQKVFRLSVEVSNALKLAAAQRSVAAGRRVTEMEIVEQALRQCLRGNN